MNQLTKNILPKVRSVLNRHGIVPYLSFSRAGLCRLSTHTHKVNNLEKKFLVWTKKFKTIEEIPAYLPPDMVERARNRMRIRLANIMMALTLVACLVMAISGKRAQERGESLQKVTIDWHNQLREAAKTEKKDT